MQNSHTLWSQYRRKSLECLNIGFHCSLCARPAQAGIDLCQPCEQWLVPRVCQLSHGVFRALCLTCGESVDSEGYADGQDIDSAGLYEGRHYCPDCQLRGERLFTRINAPYRYAFPLDSLIKRIKYAEDRQLARVLGTLLGRAVMVESQHLPLPDTLVPMPLHSAKWLQRGFNQAEDIARWCGRYLDVQVMPSMASRLVDTGSLAGLSRAERLSRIVGAFRAHDDALGKRIAIVDDVMTTGASARELARELYDSGAASVELWVLARTSSKRTASA